MTLIAQRSMSLQLYICRSFQFHKISQLSISPECARIFRQKLIKQGAFLDKTKSAAAGANNNSRSVGIVSIADIMERERANTITDWLARVEAEPEFESIPLIYGDRSGRLPQLPNDVIVRLRLETGTHAPISAAAAAHGNLRRRQGYTVALLIEGSHPPRVSIFTTLHNNVKQVDFWLLLPSIITIADEVDAQLRQQMLRFMAAERHDSRQFSLSEG